MSLWMRACVAVTSLLQGTSMRVRSKSMLGPLRVRAPTHPPVSVPDTSKVTPPVSVPDTSKVTPPVSVPDKSKANDYYNKQYAFVVKYKMAKIVGVEISHTSLVVCAKAEFQDYIDRFEKWCTPLRAKSPEGCWKASSRWSKTWTSGVQASLQESMEQRSFYGGMSSCTEYEFAGDDGTGIDPGIKIVKFGNSQFFKELRRRQMDSQMCEKEKWTARLGNWTLAFIVNSKRTMDVYPVGPVDKDDVAKAYQNMRSSGSGLDFNPSTYHFWQHNCHDFTEAMLLFLKLPYWNPDGGLPSSFSPEDSKKNPVFSYFAGKFVNFWTDPGHLSSRFSARLKHWTLSVLLPAFSRLTGPNPAC